MPEVIQALRDSVVFLITVIIKKYQNSELNSSEYALNFENELFNLYPISVYVKKVITIGDIIQLQDGYFTDDVLINRYINNTMSVADIVDYIPNHEDSNPRDFIVKKFVYLLVKHSSYYSNNNDIALQIARTIEKSCYNAVIKNSKNSEDPPCRKWTSAIFITMYSNRCGIVYNILNPESTTSKTYGSTLISDILDKKINIEEIGYKTERELCPKSIEKEQKEIDLRSEQYVKEKESNLFGCPRCKERKVTYKEVQLRAIDEAPDYLCRCLSCGHRFKG